LFNIFKKNSHGEDDEKEEEIAALMENAGVSPEETGETGKPAVSQEAESSADSIDNNTTVNGTTESSTSDSTADAKSETEAVDEEGKVNREDLTDEELEALEKQEKERKREEKEKSKEEQNRKKEAAKAAKAYEKQKEKAKKKEGKYRDPNLNIVKELFSLIIYIGIVIVACYLIIAFVGQRTTVHGESMEPCLQSGDDLWIDKLSYNFSDPKRFDIVVFPYQDEEVYYIKRVIGLPGETIQILDSGEIVVNGQYLKENYGMERISDNGIAGDPITLGEDEFFVLGDNRNNSRDSRWADVGLIKKERIVGKAILRIAPFENFGKLK